MIRATLIGNGGVGRAVRARGEALGWRFPLVVDRDPVDWRAVPLPDVAFLAIPSGDGVEALGYIRHFAGQGVPIVTCEKGALAERFDEIRPLLAKVGFDAAVGGGTRMLPYLRSRPRDQIVSLSGVLNGTLNFLADELTRGVAPEAAAAEALRLRYAEPGAGTFEEIVASEIGDLSRKARIVANVSGLADTIAPTLALDAHAAARALAEASASRRFAFSLGKQERPAVVSARFALGEWCGQVGVFEVAHLPFQAPRGVENVLAIEEATGTYAVYGPGAGPEATASAMVENAKELLGI